MKILYLGTVCELHKYEALLKQCKTKPSVAAVVFETALIRGFSENKSDVQILSYPMVPTFPNCPVLYFGSRTEKLYSYSCRWLRTVNLPVLKQWIRRLDARRAIKTWAKENRGEGVILSYSIPPFLVKDIVRYGKHYDLKTAAIIPDLLENMYINHKGNPLVDMAKQWYLDKALKYQGAYDGYIYLTESMREVVSREKPYIVMEGILDNNDAPCDDHAPGSRRGIMYAGRMHEKYGVLNLVSAFEELKETDIELWLFGEGTASEEIQNRAKKDSRIRYFGGVSRGEVLRYERKATLLVNPRSTKESFTKYSFPSKTIEYMASGTPLLTTKLEGIPEEYYEYVFYVEDNDVNQLKNALEGIISLAGEDLVGRGKAAQQFVLENKIAKTQAGRIVNFLENLSGDHHGVSGKEKV